MNPAHVMDAFNVLGYGALPTARNKNGKASTTSAAVPSGIAGSRELRCAVVEIPAEADRVLVIWGDYKRREGGAVTLGYPRHSAGFASGGASTEDSFDELVEAADRRTGAIADAILDELSMHGYTRQVLAIWNRYLGDVARFRGDHQELLMDGCQVFLIEAKKRGIAV